MRKVYWKLESGGLMMTDRPAILQLEDYNDDAPAHFKWGKKRKYENPSNASLQRLMRVYGGRANVEIEDSTVIVYGCIKIASRVICPDCGASVPNDGSCWYCENNPASEGSVTQCQ